MSAEDDARASGRDAGEVSEILINDRCCEWPYGMFDKTWLIFDKTWLIAPDSKEEFLRENAQGIDFIKRAHIIWPGIEWMGFPDKSR